ncbi:MAG: hypothetical protein KC590_03570 [Nitrospira sp.]|nr:hypothetical protein [Nitrospira sp.]
MRLSAYSSFHKVIQRTRLLYEATIHSYHVFYESGRETLRDPAARELKIEFKLGQEIVKRPLKVVTYHARDVYPELLRSTLLIRLVAAYEAFLVEAVEEVSRRSSKPFMTDSRVDFSQEQLITIDSEEGVFPYIVERTLRRLTSGGLRETRKFYLKGMGFDLVDATASFDAIEEVHDRRHLFVHRSGYTDREYEKKYPESGISGGVMLSVPESYLAGAIIMLDSSALHIKRNLESLFPSPSIRQYVGGDLTFPADPHHLQYISFRPHSEQGRSGFSDLSLDIGKGKSLRSIAAWVSDDGNEIRLLVGGTDTDMKALRLHLRDAVKKGYIGSVKSFKVKR